MSQTQEIFCPCPYGPPDTLKVGEAFFQSSVVNFWDGAPLGAQVFYGEKKHSYYASKCVLTFRQGHRVGVKETPLCPKDITREIEDGLKLSKYRTKYPRHSRREEVAIAASDLVSVEDGEI